MKVWDLISIIAPLPVLVILVVMDVTDPIGTLVGYLAFLAIYRFMLKPMVDKAFESNRKDP